MGEIGYPKDCTFKKESREILLAVGEWGERATGEGVDNSRGRRKPDLAV